MRAAANARRRGADRPAALYEEVAVGVDLRAAVELHRRGRSVAHVAGHCGGTQPAECSDEASLAPRWMRTVEPRSAVVAAQAVAVAITHAPVVAVEHEVVPPVVEAPRSWHQSRLRRLRIRVREQVHPPPPRIQRSCVRRLPGSNRLGIRGSIVRVSGETGREGIVVDTVPVQVEEDVVRHQPLAAHAVLEVNTVP